MGKVVFPFDSYVSPLYDASAKKVDEYILMEGKLTDTPYYPRNMLLPNRASNTTLLCIVERVSNYDYKG